MSIKIFKDGKELDIKDVDDWEKKRIKKAYKFLQNKVHSKNILNDKNNIIEMRKELTVLKSNISEEEMRKILKTRLNISYLGMKFVNFLCGGKRKSSIIEMVIDDCNADEVQKGFMNYMLNNNEINSKYNLSANPDHYILKGIGKNTQEVVEAPAGLFIQTQFFIEYGNDNGLKSKIDKDYPFQATGRCCLKDGTCIGGVRHQMRNENKGTRAKLEVEFPSLMPKSLLKEHQLHLACEFKNWFTDIVEEKNKI